MAHSPLSQFEIKPLINLNLFGLDISYTNSAFFMTLAIVIFALVIYSLKKKLSVIPGRMQSFCELIYEFTEQTLIDNVGKGGMQFFPMVFSLFLFIIICNLLGMIPYSFTVTSHIIVTFALAFFVFLVVTISGFIKHGMKFLSLFLPAGTPAWLAPLMIVIELFTFLARPVSLSIRLAANLMAGHVLLKVIAGFVLMMGVVGGWLPIPFIIIFTGFEIFVAILQAYIFTILTCVYLNDAVNLH